MGEGRGARGEGKGLLHFRGGGLFCFYFIFKFDSMILVLCMLKNKYDSK